MPNASAPNAPCVAVWLSPHTTVMPGSVRPCSGAITWTMPWFGSPIGKLVTPNSAVLRRSVSTCLAEISSAIGRWMSAVGTLWSSVATVRSGRRTVRPREAQAVERLRAGDLVDEVEVDVEQVGLARRRVHHVAVPDLLGQRHRTVGHAASHFLRYASCGMDIVTGVGVLDKAVHVLRAVADASTVAQRRCRLRRGSPGDRPSARRCARGARPVAARRRGPLRSRSRAWRRWAGSPPSASRWPRCRCRCSSGCVTRPVRASSCSSARAHSVDASCRSSRRTRCAGSCPRACCSPSTPARPGACSGASRAIGGWVQSVEEREPGVASVSAPVHGADGAVVAAVSISGPVERMTRDPGERFGQQVVAAASQIAT